jgi:predicted N-acetyltransferase YhbS
VDIRLAKVEDAPKIRALVCSLSHYYLKDKHSDLPPWFSKTLEIDEFKRRVSSADFLTFVCTDGASIVGYISFKGSNHLYHLFVAESHQGIGLAKKLWRHAVSKIGGGTYTVRSSIYAIPVYESFGFIKSEPEACKDGIGFQPMSTSA